MWNLTILIAFICLLWYCSIKAYFSNRKDRMEGEEKEQAEIIDFDNDDDDFIDWDTGTHVHIIHTKK
jgi:hypothetical protein